VVHDRRLQRGVRHGARRRGLPHRRRIRLRPPGSRRRGGRRGTRQRAPLHGARDERLADPAARGRVPRDRARSARRDRSRIARTGVPWLRRRPAGDSPLRHRDFALYVAATVATSFAIEMSFVAIGWQVYEIHRDPLDLGIVGLAMFLPLPLLALPAGHLSDRYPRRTVLALSLALDAAVAIGLLAVTRAGANETWPFFALAFVTGVASAVGSPAGRAMTPSLVPQEILVK